MATDYDRNRNAMIESGKVKPDATKIVWTSAALPNDAVAVPKTASQDMVGTIQKLLLEVTADQAKTLLPAHYTGFIASTHATYEPIVKAGIAVGKIKPRAA